MLVMTTKGLSEDEILEIADISREEWGLFYAIFNKFIIRYNGWYLIINNKLKKALLDLNEE